MSGSAGRPRLTLVLLSGGVDSTFCAWDLLANSDDDLLTHHVRMRNQDGRDRVEAAAVADIVAHLQARWPGRLTHTESGVDLRGFGRVFGWDAVTVAAHAGLAAVHHYATTGRAADRWTLGMNLEDLSAGLHGSRQSIEWAFEAAAGEFVAGMGWDYFRPAGQRIPKARMISLLGPTLMAMTWSCRHPTYRDGHAHPCRECRPCVEIAPHWPLRPRPVPTA